MTTSKIVFKFKKVTSRLALIIVLFYMVCQITVITLLIFLLGEQLYTSRYNILLVQSITGLSLMLSIVILGSLIFKCVKTYVRTRSKIAGIYTIAVIALSLQLFSALIYVESTLNGKPHYIYPTRNPWASSSFTDLTIKLFSIYDTTRFISFIAVWMASMLLTKSYAKKIGEKKYWIIVSIPAIYFLFQYSTFLLNQLGVLSPLLTANEPIFPNFYKFILSTVNVGLGILFGISFLILARAFTHERLKYYLIICGTGIMIIFSSNVSTVLVKSVFPAWGVIAISFVLPASFLILIGLDSATSYVAGDIKVRSYISKSKKQFELFRALASAKASTEAENKVHQIIKQFQGNIESEALFASRSELEDIKEYVDEVMTELKKSGRLNNTKSDD